MLTEHRIVVKSWNRCFAKEYRRSSEDKFGRCIFSYFINYLRPCLVSVYAFRGFLNIYPYMLIFSWNLKLHVDRNGEHVACCTFYDISNQLKVPDTVHVCVCERICVFLSVGVHACVCERQFKNQTFYSLLKDQFS